MKERTLTAKEQAFVDAYAGDATYAAKVAGYSGSPETLRSTASKVLKKPHIQAALRNKNYSKTKRRVMERNEILENLSMLAEDPQAAPRDRIAALEKLAKANGMFTERIISQNLNANIGLEAFSDDMLTNAVAGLLLQAIFTNLLTVDQARQIHSGDLDEIAVTKMIRQIGHDDQDVIDIDVEPTEVSDY